MMLSAIARFDNVQYLTIEGFGCDRTELQSFYCAVIAYCSGNSSTTNTFFQSGPGVPYIGMSQYIIQ